MKKQTYDLEERLLEYTEIAVECSVLDICFSFDVGRSMFDVHLPKQLCTFIRECLQNNLVFMGVVPGESISAHQRQHKSESTDYRKKQQGPFKGTVF